MWAALIYSIYFFTFILNTCLVNSWQMLVWQVFLAVLMVHESLRHITYDKLIDNGAINTRTGQRSAGTEVQSRTHPWLSWTCTRVQIKGSNGNSGLEKCLTFLNYSYGKYQQDVHSWSLEIKPLIGTVNVKITYFVKLWIRWCLHAHDCFLWGLYACVVFVPQFKTHILWQYI